MFIQVSAIKALPAFMLEKVIDSRRNDSELLSLSSPVQPACRPRRRRFHPRDRKGTCSAGARRNWPWRRRTCCDGHRDRRINRQFGSAGFDNPGDDHDIRQLQDGVGGRLDMDETCLGSHGGWQARNRTFQRSPALQDKASRASSCPARRLGPGRKGYRFLSLDVFADNRRVQRDNLDENGAHCAARPRAARLRLVPDGPVGWPPRTLCFTRPRRGSVLEPRPLSTT